jgi:ubiquitin carboxyl-terminal hydrolase 34
MGGALVHQLIGVQDCSHCSERLEPFMCLSLEVNGKRSLLESLAAFVQGEVLSGDNSFLCTTCGKKVRRVCFARRHCRARR